MKKYTSSNAIYYTPRETAESEPVATSYHDDRAWLHSYAAAAFVPFVQASISGVVIGVCLLVCLGVWGVRDYGKWALVSAVIVWALTWLTLQKRWLSLTAIERAIGVDLNHDGYIGEEPEREIIRVQINETDDSGQVTFKYANIPATYEQISVFAVGVLNGMTLAETKWTGAGKPFSLNEFRAFREELLERGLIAQANSKDIARGFVLTAAGRAVMRHYAPSPALMQDDTQNV